MKESETHRKQFVLIIPDGGGDRDRERGRSPFMAANLPATDLLAREGVCGLMQTLYADLSKSSIVAQLGMLGWDPHVYFPHGRASCELLVLGKAPLEPDDLAFRANLVTMEGGTLVSYNGRYILSEQASPLIERINRELRGRFPEIELYHNSDFRNTLVVRGSGLDPQGFLCAEPHESEGCHFDRHHLLGTAEPRGQRLVAELNRYLVLTAEILAGETANALFPWGASGPFSLPSFADHNGFDGRVGIIAAMDFLQGIAMAGGVDFFKVGNGRPNTDYRGKGEKAVELLAVGYDFVVCHINGPDEAGHMGDRELKIRCLEAIDQDVVTPVVAYFQRHPSRLGGVMIVPDHYTNCSGGGGRQSRAGAHSLEPVPFALWSGGERDAVERFDEESVRPGRFGARAISHLDLLRVLGIGRLAASEDEPRQEREQPVVA